MAEETEEETCCVVNSRRPFILKLEPVMSQLQRGETLTDAIVEKTTGRTALYLDTSIRKWFEQRGIKVTRRGVEEEPGYYLLTEAEQSVNFIPETRIAQRRIVRAGKFHGAVDPLHLDEKQRCTHSHINNIKEALLMKLSGVRAQLQFALGGRPSNRLEDGQK